MCPYKNLWVRFCFVFVFVAVVVVVFVVVVLLLVFFCVEILSFKKVHFFSGLYTDETVNYHP